jgi:dTDP-4-amino-4,6-dideoxygalactose transaminase
MVDRGSNKEINRLTMVPIHYGRQSIDSSDIEAVVAALGNEFLTTGPLVEIFETKLEQFVGSPCIVVSSGTAALHCAYAAIELEKSDEVITTPLTFIATQAAAAMFGAKIVFADIQNDTGNIDPKAVEALITNRTKAIVAVDFAGHPADLDELRQIADKHGIYLIEDAAHSLGSTYKNISIGSIADLTTFSFFPTKNITTGEGGAVASKNPDLLSKAKRFSRQGLVRNSSEFKITTEGAWHQEVHEFGLNYRLPDILCALGISQLKKVENFKKSRTDIFENYRENLCEISEIELPTKKNYVSPMWHLYPIRVNQNIRGELFNYLRNKQILVQVNYIPAHWHPVFERYGYFSQDLSKSENYYRREISLPIHPDLTRENIDFISNALLDYFN